MILRKQKTSQKRCGNCYYHCVFDYPVRVFCTLRFQRRADAVVLTLGFCEDWKPDFEECFCVREALRKNTSS